jgi:signal transduction histidine kinase
MQCFWWSGRNLLLLYENESLVRAEQLAAISEFGRRALIGIDLPQLMEEAASMVRTHLEVELANVLESLADGNVRFQAGSGWNRNLAGNSASEIAGATPAREALRSQAPVVVEDLSSDRRFPDETLLREHGVVSSLNVPLYGRDRPLGVVGAHSTRRRVFHAADIAFVQSVANVLSAVLERNSREEHRQERYLQRAEQMLALGQVAAGVAHELRNPLTAVKGLVQVNLRKAAAQGLPAQDLVIIEQEIRRMERTLENFLNFSRPPQPNRRWLNPADLIGQVVALARGRAEKQQVKLRTLQPEVHVRVEGDQDQLQQLLLNLVLNAIDAMPHGGALEIDLRAPRESMVEIYVRDTGTGIDPDVLPKLFDDFVTSKKSGVGLGLPISKRVAEEHAGSLSAYNLPGGGACFLLRLPALPSEALEESEVQTLPGSDNA